jgi:hypothetical protein
MAAMRNYKVISDAFNIERETSYVITKTLLLYNKDHISPCHGSGG